MKRFNGKWDLMGLYSICSNYLNNQTEAGAIQLIETMDKFKRAYPIIDVVNPCEKCDKCKSSFTICIEKIRYDDFIKYGIPFKV